VGGGVGVGGGGGGGGGGEKRESVERRSGIQGHWLFVVLRDISKFLCTHSSDSKCGVPLSNCYRVDQ